MKIINKNNHILKVKPISKLENVKIKEYKKGAYLFEIDDEYFLVINRKFKNKYIRSNLKELELSNATCIINDLNNETNSRFKLNIDYGDEDSIIVDMNGIDNFRFAKSLIFNDEIVRKIVLKLNVLKKNEKYLRFGCAGAKECKYHPGGEVFEAMVIDSNDGSGIAQSVSGYLPKGEKYSKSILLYDEDKVNLREERIVYSHTAFLKRCGLNTSNSICINIKPKKDNVSLLDTISEIANKFNICSYAIQIYMHSKGTENHNTKINGRVLKNMPQKAFDKVQEATDIGLEQLFSLKDIETFYGIGTHYLRYEPEWKEFTNGHQYERRGHIHCTVLGNKNRNVHEVFHLRDAYISSDTYVELVLNPIDNIYRIYPLYKKRNKYYIKSTDKQLDKLIEEVNLFE